LTKGEDVRHYILENLAKGEIAFLAAGHFGITRQAVSQHLRKMVSEGLIVASGNTRNRVYTLARLVEWSAAFVIESSLAEDRVWFRDVQPRLGDAPENVVDIWQFCFTEIFNNAIDHSGGTEIHCEFYRTALNTTITISDNGVGIFRKIQVAMGLIDERHAILELAKGKLTTDPAHHTGQGVFFASRLLDFFGVRSGTAVFTHGLHPDDWIYERPESPPGTSVLMSLNNHSRRTCKGVFDQYSSPDADYGFTRTVIPVRLARYGTEKLISRSQAKMLLARVDRFKTVVLDFEGIDVVGQSFADEIFRVFAMEHPEILVLPLNAVPEVKKMIDAALDQKRLDEQNRML